MHIKNYNGFSLSNKFVFGFVSFLLIFTLTLINNYYFYSHVERTSSRQAIQLEKLLLNYMEYNLDTDKLKMQDELVAMIKKWNNFSYYNNGLVVIDFNNEEHILKKFKKWDKSAYTDIVINLNDLFNKKKNGFILNSTTNLKGIFFSVWESMIFSFDAMYEDVTKDVISKVDGQIILIEDAKVAQYDGIININGHIFKDIKGAKTITIIDQNTLTKKEIYIPAYNELKVTAGMFIKKDDQLAQGTIHTALNNFQEIYWLRSRPFVGFAVFTFLLLYLFTKRTELLKKLHLDEVKRIQEGVQKLEEDIEKQIKIKEEILDKQNKLEEEYKSVCNQFKQYEGFVKFAFLDMSIDELLEKNSRVLGTMFRLIAEKIVFSVYEDNCRPLNKYNDNLDSCLKEIKDLNILSRDSINALYSVKQFGNNSSHYSKENENISLIKTIIIARDLIGVIEEYLQIEVESERVKKTKSEETIDSTEQNQQILKSGLKIVKKASFKS